MDQNIYRVTDAVFLGLSASIMYGIIRAVYSYGGLFLLIIVSIAGFVSLMYAIISSTNQRFAVLLRLSLIFLAVTSISIMLRDEVFKWGTLTLSRLVLLSVINAGVGVIVYKTSSINSTRLPKK